MATRKQSGDSSAEDRDAGSGTPEEAESQDVEALALHVRDLREENEDLRKRLDGLTESVTAALGFDQIGRGLSSIVSELEPLRYLVPPRNGRALPRRTVEALLRLRASLLRLDWTAVGPLGIVEPVVGFIGQAQPESDKKSL